MNIDRRDVSGGVSSRYVKNMHKNLVFRKPVKRLPAAEWDDLLVAVFSRTSGFETKSILIYDLEPVVAKHWLSRRDGAFLSVNNGAFYVIYNGNLHP